MTLATGTSSNSNVDGVAVVSTPSDEDEFRAYLALKAREHELTNAVRDVNDCAYRVVANSTYTVVSAPTAARALCAAAPARAALVSALLPPLLSRATLVHAAAADALRTRLRVQDHLALLQRTFLLLDPCFADSLLPPLVHTLLTAADAAAATATSSSPSAAATAVGDGNAADNAKPRAKAKASVVATVHRPSAALGSPTRISYNNSEASSSTNTGVKSKDTVAPMSANASASAQACALWSPQALTGLLTTALRDAAAATVPPLPAVPTLTVTPTNAPNRSGSGVSISGTDSVTDVASDAAVVTEAVVAAATAAHAALPEVEPILAFGDRFSDRKSVV